MQSCFHTVQSCEWLYFNCSALGWAWSSWWGWYGRSSWTQGTQPQLLHERTWICTCEHHTTYLSFFSWVTGWQRPAWRSWTTGSRGQACKLHLCILFPKNLSSSVILISWKHSNVSQQGGKGERGPMGVPGAQGLSGTKGDKVCVHLFMLTWTNLFISLLNVQTCLY